jgi:prepilin-type N-terminal cleavage/methylation domain-containing protein
MKKIRGFTLAELLAVMVIAVILAVTAIPALNTRDFDAARFADETRAQIAYAQKVAVAGRRTVTVIVASNSVTLTMCADAGCGSTVPVPSPQGESSFVRSVPSGVTISPVTTFTFDALGSTPATQTLTITGKDVKTLTVEAVTGYVH